MLWREGKRGPISMEKLFQGLNSQEFLELYKLLVKTELLENITLFTRSEVLERFAMTQDFMIYSDEITDYEIEDDSIFPEPCEDRFNSIINRTPQSAVEFVDLKEIYEKVQSRAGGGSHQRVSSGIINIKATSQGQLCGINVFVERMSEAAALCGDTNGRVPLEVNHEDYFQNQQLFSVDLDSVYDTRDGTPIYKLATVDAERRNLFHLIVFLKFIDGSETGPFVSKPFLIRSRKPSGSRSNSFEIN